MAGMRMPGVRRRSGTRRSGRRLRWAMPAGAVIAVGAVLAGTMLASAAGPSLPRRTPAQLLAEMASAKAPATMTAVLSETADLGLPALPAIAGMPSSPLSAASLLTGTHTIDVWYAGPRHLRIALPVSFGETDLRVNGGQVWLWQSRGQKATRYVLPAGVRLQAPVRRAGPPRRMVVLRLRHPLRSGPGVKAVPGAKIVPCSKLRTGSRPLRGTSAYRSRLRIVLRRTAGGAASCAVISAVGGPAGSAGSVTPVTPIQAADRLLKLLGPTSRVTIAGTTTVAGRSAYLLAIAPRSHRSLVGRIMIAVDAATHLPLQVQVFARGSTSPAFQFGFTSLSFARPAASNFSFTPPAGAHVRTVRLPAALPGLPGAGWQSSAGAAATPPAASSDASVRVIGSGWLAVADIPASAALSGSGSGAGPLLPLLLKAATRVHGSWGSGRLLRAGLLSVLFTSKGQILAGAVTPAVLYADAAKTQ